MNRRLGFSIALVVVLFGLWLIFTKPMCGMRFRASLVTGTRWTCVPDY